MSQLLQSVKQSFISFQTLIKFLYTGDESVITGQLSYPSLVFRLSSSSYTLEMSQLLEVQVNPSCSRFQTFIQFLYTGDESVNTGQLSYSLLVSRPSSSSYTLEMNQLLQVS